MQTLDKLLWRLVDGVILLAVLGMVCLIGLQVASRSLGNSLPWTEELSRFFFIWTVWLGLAAGFRNGHHPRVTLLSDLIDGKIARKLLDVIPALAAAVLFAIVTRHGWDLLWQQVRFGETSAILQLGMWLATLPIILGAGLAVLGALVHGLTPRPHSLRAEPIIGERP